MNKERIIKFIAGLSLFLFTVTTQCKQLYGYGEIPIRVFNAIYKMLLLEGVFSTILILCIITACMFFYFLDNVTFKKSLLLSIIINAIPIFIEILSLTLTQIAFYNPDHLDYNAYPALWFTIGGAHIMWIYFFTHPITTLLLGVLITIYTLKICFKYPYKKLLIPVLIVNVILLLIFSSAKFVMFYYPTASSIF